MTDLLIGTQALVEMVTGDVTWMKVCGRIPPHKGQEAVVVTNGEGCFAARHTARGWIIIDEPVRMFPVRERANTCEP